MQKYPLLKHKQSIITYLILLLTFTSLSLKINETIDPPRHNINKVPINQQVVESNKLISLSFPDINYQISSKMYMSLNTLLEQQIFDIHAYKASVASSDSIVKQYCQLYPTSIETRLKGNVKLPQNVTLLKYTMTKNDKKSRFYVLGSDSTLYKYVFDQISIKQSEHFTIQSQLTKIKDRQLTTNIQLMQVGGKLLFFMNSNVYYYNGKDIVNTFTNIPGYKSMQRLLDVGVYKNSVNQNDINGYQIWVAGDKQINIYQILNSGTGLTMNSIKTIQGFTTDFIAGILYCQTTKVFYVTSANNLYLLQPAIPNSQPIVYQLESQCTNINKIKQVLYISCQYEKINYVMQVRADKNNQLKLNRYYDDGYLQGIRDVESLGFDKIALIGDQQALVIGQAVNRMQLLQLANNNVLQTKYVVYSFGMIDFYYLAEYSTPQMSIALMISEQALSILSVQYVPPEVQCKLPRELLGANVNLLFAFNTTHCPYSLNDPNTIGGNLVYCETFYPYKFAIGQREFEEKTAKFVFFLLMLVAVVLILLCAGWGVKIRNQANTLIFNIQRKIEKFRNQKGTQELKKI